MPESTQATSIQKWINSKKQKLGEEAEKPSNADKVVNTSEH